MALDQSALPSLLDALRSPQNADPVRQLAEWLLQELIEAEATAHIGAGPGERTETRTAQRNGHRTKTLASSPQAQACIRSPFTPVPTERNCRPRRGTRSRR